MTARCRSFTALRMTARCRSFAALRMTAAGSSLQSRSHLEKCALRARRNVKAPQIRSDGMTTQMDYQMELAGETATLYVTGTLGQEHVDTLIHACRATPARTLRVDVHGLGTLTAEAVGAVRELLHYWRDSRRGDFRL